MQVGINHHLKWYVVRTVPVMERKASGKLQEAGFEVYLPTMRVERKNKRTHTFSTKERVLMPGYLFLGATRPLYYAAKCDGVEGILGNEGYRGAPVNIPSGLIEAIYLAEIDMQFDDTRAARIHRQEEGRTRRLSVAMQFAKGTESRVSAGPLAGLSGIVENVTHQGKVELLLELFGRATLASFNPDDLALGDKFPKAS